MNERLCVQADEADEGWKRKPESLSSLFYQRGISWRLKQQTADELDMVSKKCTEACSSRWTLRTVFASIQVMYKGSRDETTLNRAASSQLFTLHANTDLPLL
jgi:hypothetical protein